MTSSTTSTRRGDAREALEGTSHRAASPELSPAASEPALGSTDRVHLLEHALESLQAAADTGDADLARACRSVLASLRTQHRDDSPNGDAAARPSSGPTWVPPAPPRWARSSVPEDGGIVHETISPIHPAIKIGGVTGAELKPSDVSLSITDLLIDDRWIRTRPTVQVEGGSYSLDGARQLHDALHQLLEMAGEEVTAAL